MQPKRWLLDRKLDRWDVDWKTSRVSQGLVDHSPPYYPRLRRTPSRAFSPSRLQRRLLLLRRFMKSFSEQRGRNMLDEIVIPTRGISESSGFHPPSGSGPSELYGALLGGETRLLGVVSELSGPANPRGYGFVSELSGQSLPARYDPHGPILALAPGPVTSGYGPGAHEHPVRALGSGRTSGSSITAAGVHLNHGQVLRRDTSSPHVNDYDGSHRHSCKSVTQGYALPLTAATVSANSFCERSITAAVSSIHPHRGAHAALSLDNIMSPIGYDRHGFSARASAPGSVDSESSGRGPGGSVVQTPPCPST